MVRLEDKLRLVMPLFLGLWTCQQGLGQAPDSGRNVAASAVAIDEIGNTAQAKLLRIEALLAAGQWAEAVENIRTVMETSPGRLVKIGRPTGGFTRALPVGQYCQILLASLHTRAPEALRIYRRQVDPLAEQRYARALAARDSLLLTRIVDEFFLSSVGDQASWWLGELAFERGQTMLARAAWERIGPQFRMRGSAGAESGACAGYPIWQFVPQQNSEEAWLQLEAALGDSPLADGWLAYPDSDLDLDAVRARLALVSLSEGDIARATAEIGLLSRLAPDAHGKIGGRSGKLVSLLNELRQESLQWPRAETEDVWSTFAGSPTRNRTLVKGVDVGGAPIWQVDLARHSVGSQKQGKHGVRVAELPDGLLGYHPLIVRDLVLLQHGSSPNACVGFDLRNGRRRVGAGVDTSVDAAKADALPARAARRFTTTASGDRFFACVDFQDAPMSRLVGLDIHADFKLVLDVRLVGGPWEGAWRFAGAPVAAGSRLYVALQRTDQVRPEAHVACLDAYSGRLCWRRFVCAADAQLQPHPQLPQNLLTMYEGTLYLNTNLGVVAAVRAGDGKLQWAVQYPRIDRQHRDPDRNELHWMRDLNPCLVEHGRVMAAPRDCQHLFCLDAITGTLLWATPAGQGADIVHLVGVRNGRFIASGECLYWFDAVTGKILCRFPSSFQPGAAWARPSPRGYGRGLLARDQVWWPTRDAIYVFRQRTIKTERGHLPDLVRRVDLADRGATGGHLFIAGDVLLIAGADRLTAFNESGYPGHDRRPASGRTAQ